MRKIPLGLLLLVTCLAFLLPVGSAQAQLNLTRTFVSGVGDDVNPCTRTAPCKTFAGAIFNTSAGGEIDCLDPGGFGAVTITKAITIDCSHTLGGVLVGASNGINVAASASDVVVLRGLDIFGNGVGLSGISFTTGAALHVEQTRIRNFNAGTTSYGISFTPTGPSQLYVTDSWITNNGSGILTINLSNGGGILVKPAGSGTARVAIDNVRIAGNGKGIVADGTAASGASVVHVNRSIISANVTQGLLVLTGNSMAVMLDRTVVSNNPLGVNANGPESAVFLSGTTVYGSTAGLSQNGGVILSYGTNTINGGSAPTDGAPNVMLGQN